jgi:hypothetical protein
MSGPTVERWAKPTAARYPTLRSALYCSAEDFLRLALQAHYAAVRDMQPPDGQRWLWSDSDLVEPMPWGGAEFLHDQLLHHLGERLRRLAIERGHLAEVPCAPDPEDDFEDPPLPGAGRSPAVKGQGWPVLVPAVGPALQGPQALDITTAAEPLSVCPSGKELPGETPASNFNETGEILL